MDSTLQRFLASIEAQSWAEIDAMSVEVAADHEEKTDRVRAQAEREAEGRRQAALSAIAQEQRLAADARRAENRRSLLAFREECAREAMTELRSRVDGFTASPAYKDRLVSLAEKGIAALGSAGKAVVLYLRREDMGLADALRKGVKSASVTVKEGDLALGGVIVEAEDRRADLSFDSGFEAARDRFSEIFGMEIP